MTRKNIGEASTELRRKNKQEVYDALLDLREKATVKTIWMHLDRKTRKQNQEIVYNLHAKYKSKVYNWTKKDMDKQVQKNMKITISPRTIERCIKDDSRIHKDGTYYFISDKARFERRYQRPEGFGRSMHWWLFDSSNLTLQSLDHDMGEFIRRWGALTMFSFIEAVRPFVDKSMSPRDRSQLVTHWAQNVLPINEMFNYFQPIFGSEHLDHCTGEMDESRIKELLDSFKRTYPDLFRILMEARAQLPYTSSDGKDIVIHGKTYHSGLSDYLSYIKETNPRAYKCEMERLDKQRTIRNWRISQD